jgi:NADH-quinone oxidoreductase subunit L
MGAGEPAEFNLIVAGGSLAVALIALLLAWSIYGQRKTLAKAGGADPLVKLPLGIYKGMENKWWVDELYRALIVRPYEALSDFLAHPVDQGLIDGIANGFGTLTASLAGVWRRLQTGYVRSYALMILLGAVAILTYLAFLSR